MKIIEDVSENPDAPVAADRVTRMLELLLIRESNLQSLGVADPNRSFLSEAKLILKNVSEVPDGRANALIETGRTRMLNQPRLRQE